MSQTRSVLVALLFFSSLAIVADVASADDFAPPPWPRPGAPNPQAMTFEWEFSTPANPSAPDGPLTDMTFGSGMAPGGTFAFVGAPGPIFWGAGDGDCEWIFAEGGFIHFELDNILDTEPVKHIWLQVSHSFGAAVSVMTLADFNMAATGSTPDVPVVTPIDPTHTLITWNMFPNPPWEEFDLVIPTAGASIDQVVIDTISIPEPSTLALAGVALSAVVLVARRSRKRR